MEPNSVHIAPNTYQKHTSIDTNICITKMAPGKGHAVGDVIKWELRVAIASFPLKKGLVPK